MQQRMNISAIYAKQVQNFDEVYKIKSPEKSKNL